MKSRLALNDWEAWNINAGGVSISKEDDSGSIWANWEQFEDLLELLLRVKKEKDKLSTERMITEISEKISNLYKIPEKDLQELEETIKREFIDKEKEKVQTLKRCIQLNQEWRTISDGQELIISLAPLKFAIDEIFGRNTETRIDKIRKETEQITMDKGVSKEKASKMLNKINSHQETPSGNIRNKDLANTNDDSISTKMAQDASACQNCGHDITCHDIHLFSGLVRCPKENCKCERFQDSTKSESQSTKTGGQMEIIKIIEKYEKRVMAHFENHKSIEIPEEEMRRLFTKMKEEIAEKSASYSKLNKNAPTDEYCAKCGKSKSKHYLLNGDLIIEYNTGLGRLCDGFLLDKEVSTKNAPKCKKCGSEKSEHDEADGKFQCPDIEEFCEYEELVK